MSDIRERHVPCYDVWCRPNEAFPGTMCSDDEQTWPCDAIREADEKDAAERRASMAESLLTHARRDIGAALIRADKAEAALAEKCPDCGLTAVEIGRIHVDAQMGEHDYLGPLSAARADAKRLAEALLTTWRYIDPHYHGLTYAEVDSGDIGEVIENALDAHNKLVNT